MISDSRIRPPKGKRPVEPGPCPDESDGRRLDGEIGPAAREAFTRRFPRALDLSFPSRSLSSIFLLFFCLVLVLFGRGAIYEKLGGSSVRVFQVGEGWVGVSRRDLWW